MQHQKSEKKKVVVTLCRVFPVTHSLAGKPTEFEGKLKSIRRYILYATIRMACGIRDIKILHPAKISFSA